MGKHRSGEEIRLDNFEDSISYTNELLKKIIDILFINLKREQQVALKVEWGEVREE